jgi:preprotein translocase subunit SecA
VPEKQFSKSQRQTIESVLKHSVALRGLTDQGLRDVLSDVRESVFSKSRDMSLISTQVLAISKEACSRVLGYDLYDVQMLAADALINDQIAEMQTGEGKTVSAVPAAVFGGILGRGAHVATPNSYLAGRDFEQLQGVYESLGLSVGLLESGGDANDQKAKSYACDITYGPGYEFGFDYLRDQLLLKQRDQMPPGQVMIDNLTGQNSFPICQIRGLGFSIVDEADNVLLDDATSPQVLSEFQAGDAPDKEAVLLASRVAKALEDNTHFREPAPQQIELTPEGVDAIHQSEIAIPVNQLIRPWTKYVEAALKADRLFFRDVNYIVQEEEVRIVDESTGRIFEDRTWQSGMHQAIEAKEQVRITPESLPLAQITRQRFYRLYEHLSGMTGTAQNCHAEFKTVYGLGTRLIPLRVPSRRQTYPFRAFARQRQKWDAIIDSVKEIHALRRPVLIGTRTISESVVLAGLLEEAGLGFVLLNGQQDSEEAEVVAAAGAAGEITIATNLAGRGTDIKLGPGVSELGGLHVVVSECQGSYRVDRQLIGRCGRQGDPGSSQTFVSADDWLLVTHAPWLSDSLRGVGSGAKGGEAGVDVEPKVRRVQKQLEKEHYGARLQLLQQNQRQNDILASHWY